MNAGGHIDLVTLLLQDAYRKISNKYGKGLGQCLFLGSADDLNASLGLHITDEGRVCVSGDYRSLQSSYISKPAL